jgi:hypothetical protein
MRALVVVESMFGNTEEVAEAIAAGLSADGVETSVLPVREAPTSFEGVDLLVVGGPTHAFTMSRPSTRADAEDKGADTAAAEGIGLREWIDQLRGDAAVHVAVFDTKVQHPHLPGSAARAARKRLRSRGFPAVDPATTFWVAGTPGPVLSGELDRARRWGSELATLVTSSAA